MSIAGILIIAAGGILSGLYTAPMKWLRNWQLEHVWTVYALYGMVLFPWMVTFFSVPNTADVLRNSPGRAVGMTVLFGFLWGFGSVLFGKGTAIVGNSLGFSLILGLTSALGSALPLVALHTSEVGSKEGICTWISLVIACCGLYVLSRAGVLRDQQQRSSKGGGRGAAINGSGGEQQPLVTTTAEGIQHSPGAVQPISSFSVGLLYCLASGILSPMFNIAASLSADVGDEAKAEGADHLFANNVAWALTVTAGSCANLGFCLVTCRANNSWHIFSRGSVYDRFHDCMLGVLMGVLWYSGNILYGIGVQIIGSLGTVLGWPVFMSFMVIAANVFGFSTGEWKGTTARAKAIMAVGLLILLIAVAIVAVGSL
eukprot:m.145992 g.145992  ORF g.145992 m.145992 type:complete len:371 (-) comp20516_c0_seq7:48-1160(-)